jgi:spermidine synthase
VKLGGGAAYPGRERPEGLESFGEPVAPSFDHVFHGSLVHRERSQFQTVEVFDHEHFGRMLVLDGLIQTTELDEFCYHEMLVHPALLSREPVERVLVIGGGDGGTLRHVLQHGPSSALMCEIDEAVTRLSGQLLAPISAGALGDERAEIVFDDGAALVRRHSDEFDAIVVDSTDPIGAAVVLFSEGFYADCRRALRPDGVIVTQSGSPLYQASELAQTVKSMSRAFESVEVYTGFVPTYPGVLWSFTAGTNGRALSDAGAQELADRARARGIAAKFWTPELQVASFALPTFLREAIGAPTPSASVSRG